MSTRPPQPDRIPERLIPALLPDITARRPAPTPASLPALPAPSPTGIDHPGGVLLGTARIDRSGRFHARLLLRALGWEPGRELDLDAIRDAVVIVAAVGGVHRVDHRGAIALPSAARRLCAIPAGDAVVLVAEVPRQRIVVRPVGTVVRLLTAHTSGTDRNRR
jgi:bifunctional DNA-binding transcriptional regulator/antitoxin component of YhaV-PrlF toxin-antitoxin module